VIEVDRPNRAERRRSGKSDPLDAVEAARAALGGRAKSISKSKDGAVEAIRVLVVAKRSARAARVKALTQMRHLVITAPEQLRCHLKGMTVAALTAEAARLRPSRSHAGRQLAQRPSKATGVLGFGNQFDGVALETVPDDRRAAPGTKVRHRHKTGPFLRREGGGALGSSTLPKKSATAWDRTFLCSGSCPRFWRTSCPMRLRSSSSQWGRR
jgi:hypothetical protein